MCVGPVMWFWCAAMSACMCELILVRSNVYMRVRISVHGEKKIYTQILCRPHDGPWHWLRPSHTLSVRGWGTRQMLASSTPYNRQSFWRLLSKSFLTAKDAMCFWRFFPERRTARSVMLLQNNVTLLLIQSSNIVLKQHNAILKQRAASKQIALVPFSKEAVEIVSHCFKTFYAT